MTTKEIIDGLKFTVDMFLFNPSTGETYTEPRNDMDKTTIDACKGAIELLEQTDGDLISKINFAISATDSKDDYSVGLRNGMRYVISLIDNKEPNFEKTNKQTDGDLISRKDLLNKIWQKVYGKDYDGVNLLDIPHIDIIENMPSYNSIKTELNEDLVKENTDLVKEDVENADKKCISEETVSQSLVKDGDLINCEYILKQIEITEEKLNFTFETLKDFIKILPTYSANLVKDGDLISRKAVFDMLKKIDNAVYDGEGYQYKEWVDYVEELPTYSTEQTDTKQEIGTTNKVLADVFNKIVKMSNDELVELLKLIDNPQTDSVLKDIKEEFIKIYPHNYCGEPELGGVICEFSLNDVLKIIDKYISGQKLHWFDK